MTEIDAIILASGLSRRMGGNKLLLPLGHTTVIGHFLSCFPYELFEKVILVFSDERVKEIGKKYPVEICYNTTPEHGKSHSIQIGLQASEAEDGTMFFVADQPLLQASTIAKLVVEFKHNKDAIVVPSVHGKTANPVIFPSDCRTALLRLKGDCGGRQIVWQNLHRVSFISFDSEDEFVDIDTLPIYKKVINQWP